MMGSDRTALWARLMKGNNPSQFGTAVNNQTKTQTGLERSEVLLLLLHYHYYIIIILLHPNPTHHLISYFYTGPHGL